MADESFPAKDSRNLVFSDGSSHKFWKIELDGAVHSVTFGRVGTNGQTQTKDFGSEDAARKAFDKLVGEKTRKGYVDEAGTSSTPTKPAEKASGKQTANEPANEPAKKAAKQPASPAPAPTPIVAPSTTDPISNDIDFSVTREFDLKPTDWRRATFRTHPPLERGTPAPFDRDACLQRILKLKTTTYGWDVCWSDLKLPPALSRQESAFWLVAMTTERDRITTMKTFAERIAKQNIPEVMTIEEAWNRIEKAPRGLPLEATLVLANLLTPDEYLNLLIRNPSSSQQAWQSAEYLRVCVDGFNKYVMPYLTAAQRDSIRERIRSSWDPSHAPATSYDSFPGDYYLAASLGMHDAVHQVISSWADDRYQQTDWSDHYQRPQELVMGLASPELVAAEWRRLKLRLRSADDVRALIACTETLALDCIVDSILAETNKDKCEELLTALTLVRAPEAAEPMLQCKMSSKTPSIARDWLDKNVGRAVVGLIPTAAGKGKLADAALEYLRGVKRRGLTSVIAAAVQDAHPAGSAAKVQSEVLDREEKVYEPCDDSSTPSWLAQEIAAVGVFKRKPLPAWANASLLPPLVVGERRLHDEQIGLVLQLLAATPADAKHALLTALRAHVAATARDEFAWKLFQSWQEDGYPSKEKWAMGAVAHLGDDGSVLKLTRLIRNWPGESQHARAVFGLECLRAIGSSTALMQLAGIAQKLKFKGLKAKAEQFVSEIAQERGLTRDELEDRVVPDCGLDDQGHREFSFGARAFSFVLGGDLKAMVRDESGKIRPNLPDANAKDDSAAAEEAHAEWKLLKKQIKEVATIQAGRLEQAMITGRRWGVADFSTLLVQHPLMTHLAQKLIWGGFDAQGQRVVAFRVTEERDCADPDDEVADLSTVAAVGVVHPLELSESERSRWGELLGDYEIVSPFPQLGRAVHALEPGEEEAPGISRFKGLKLAAPTLVFTLEKLGWLRGLAMDGGCFDEHSKQFPAANVTAVIHYEGTVGMGYILPDEMLTLEGVHFCRGMRTPSGYGWNSEENVPLRDVSPIVISEVLADMQVLKSKGK